MLCVSGGTGWDGGSWVWTGLCPGVLSSFSSLTRSPLSSVTSELCSLHYYEAHAESLWSEGHRTSRALSCSQAYEPLGLKIRELTRDPSVCRVHKSHHISSHPLALASNDAVLKLPWALPVPCYHGDCWFFYPVSFPGFSGTGCNLLLNSQEHIHTWDNWRRFFKTYFY